MLMKAANIWEVRRLHKRTENWLELTFIVKSDQQRLLSSSAESQTQKKVHLS